MKYSCKWFVNGIDTLSVHCMVHCYYYRYYSCRQYTNWRIQWSEQDAQTIVIRKKCYYHKFFHDKNQFLSTHSLPLSHVCAHAHRVCLHNKNHVPIKWCVPALFSPKFSVLNKFWNQNRRAYINKYKRNRNFSWVHVVFALAQHRIEWVCTCFHVPFQQTFCIEY